MSVAAELVGVILVAVVGASSTAGSWYGRRRARAELERSDAGTAQMLVTTALQLLKPYEARIDSLELRDGERRVTVRRLHNRVDSLERHVAKLEAELARAGVEIPPRPTEE